MLDIAQVVVDIALAGLSGAALWRTLPKKPKGITLTIGGGYQAPQIPDPSIESIIPHPTVPDSMYVTYRRGAFIKKVCLPNPPPGSGGDYFLKHKAGQF
jgi:hypothetical protein